MQGLFRLRSYDLDALAYLSSNLVLHYSEVGLPGVLEDILVLLHLPDD